LRTYSTQSRKTKYENERQYHCLNDKYVIDVYDKNGKIIRKIDRPYEPVPTTAEDMKRYVDGFGNSSEKHKSLIEKFTKMPGVKTVTERMFVDDVGNLPPSLIHFRVIP